MSELELKHLLDESVERFNRRSFIETDPISIPHLFSQREDIEIAAFLAATIAWGQRITLIRNAKLLMTWMDMAPYSFITDATDKDLLVFKKFVHRTFNGDDCLFLIKRLQIVYKQYHTLELLFYNEKNQVKDGIINFRSMLLSGHAPHRIHKHVSNPMAGSAAKRINMFLRWMVRKDDKKVDFGIWEVFTPSQLICPLDVHSGSVARLLGLLHRKQNDWQAAEELTNRLKDFDPVDPVKYDFALFGLGAFDKLLKNKP